MNFTQDEQFLPCPACHQANSTHHDVCPNCGYILHAKSIRVRGAISIVLGSLLVGGMGYLMVLIATIIRHSNDPGASTRFTGSPSAAAGIFAILGFVLLFGIITTIMGAWMLRYGWRNPKLKRIVWIFGIIFWFTYVVVWMIELF
ncbi:MAG TPA: hypothetical protein VEF04_17795 [Blastocatellia bacterium]|nr:hypothetical protein [Blastocatellia bacterium]